LIEAYSAFRSRILQTPDFVHDDTAQKKHESRGPFAAIPTPEPLLHFRLLIRFPLIEPARCCLPNRMGALFTARAAWTRALTGFGVQKLSRRCFFKAVARTEWPPADI
jgi:hypothetical protein